MWRKTWGTKKRSNKCWDAIHNGGQHNRPTTKPDYKRDESEARPKARTEASKYNNKTTGRDVANSSKWKTNFADGLTRRKESTNGLLGRRMVPRTPLRLQIMPTWQQRENTTEKNHELEVVRRKIAVAQENSTGQNHEDHAKEYVWQGHKGWMDMKRIKPWLLKWGN